MSHTSLQQDKAPTIAIAAGGTGGHFFPALALSKELAKRGYHLILVTDERTAGNLNGFFSNYPHIALPPAAIVGRSRLRQIGSVIQLLRNTLNARRFLRHYNVKAIVGFGGYASVPPILGGWLEGRKRPALIIHEGNAKMGRANAVLAHIADVTALSFPKTIGVPKSAHQIVTGMPIRQEITQIPTKNIDISHETSFHLLIWGGSLGAKIFAREIPRAISIIPEKLRKKLIITQQVSKEDINNVEEIYRDLHIKADIRPFFENVASLLNNANLVIGRSGGSSVAELLATATPGIFIPYPNAAGDEQTLNAKTLQEHGAGWIVTQKQLGTQKLTHLLEKLLSSPEKLNEASCRAKHLSRTDAAAKMAHIIEETILNRKGER